MNIFNKVTLQGLKKNRTRTIVTIIGVILSATMITAVTTFISSLQNFLVQTVIATDGDWHIKYNDTDNDFISKLTADKRISRITVTQNIGYAKLDGSINENKPYLFINGFNDEAFENVPLKIITGRLPQNERELLISDHIQNNGGANYKVGDTLRLSIGERSLGGEKLRQYNPFQSGQEGEAESFTPTGTKIFTVVGICERPAFEPYSAPGYSVITRLDNAPAENISNLNGYVRLRRPDTVYKFTEEYAGEVETEYNRDLLRFQGVSDDDNFNTVLYTLGGILIGLIMIGSVLLIHNSFSISVSERTRQFGILSSVGATKKQLRKSVLFEGACIGLIGIPLGILLGIGGIGITLVFIGGIFKEMSSSNIPLTLHLSAASVIIAMIVGIITILISAYIPAKKAAKLSAIDAIRQTADIQIKAKKVKTSKLTQKLFGLEGTLAMKNFKRNKKRYRSTVISLFVSIVLFISASAFGMYMQQGANNSVKKSGFDISFQSGNLSTDRMLNLYDKMKNVKGITDSGYQMALYYSTTLPLDVLSKRSLEYINADQLAEKEYSIGIIINFIDDAAFAKYVNELGLNKSDYMENSSKLLAYTMMNIYDPETGRYLAFDLFENNNPIRLSVKPGENPEAVQNKDIELNLVDKMPATVLNTINFGINIIAPFSFLPDYNYETIMPNSPSLQFSSDDPAKSVEEIRTILKDNQITSGYSLYNVAEMEQTNRNIMLVINVFTYGFIILISLITVANVFNTISTNINLRRREFAMLKSLGMTNRGFYKMMNFECLFYGLKSLFYGLPVAFAITFLIYNAVMVGVDVPFSLPWGSIGISTLSVFLVVFVTMLYSISKVKKENTVEALKTDIL